jgi:hypothetical protein
VFLEFADEEREHLELLIREYRALLRRQSQRKPATGNRRTARPKLRSAPSAVNPTSR